MKRKRNYNVKHKGGGKFDKSIPQRRADTRLRPVASADPGANITDDPAALFFYTIGILILFFIVKIITR